MIFRPCPLFGYGSGGEPDTNRERDVLAGPTPVTASSSIGVATALDMAAPPMEPRSREGEIGGVPRLILLRLPVSALSARLTPLSESIDARSRLSACADSEFH